MRLTRHNRRQFSSTMERHGFTRQLNTRTSATRLGRRLFIVITLNRTHKIRRLQLAASRLRRGKWRTIPLTISSSTRLRVGPLVPNLFLGLNMPVIRHLRVRIRTLFSVSRPIFHTRRQRPILSRHRPYQVVQWHGRFAKAIRITFTHDLFRAMFLRNTTRRFFCHEFTLSTLNFHTHRRRRFKISIQHQITIMNRHRHNTIFKLVLPARMTFTTNRNRVELERCIVSSTFNRHIQ